MKKLMLATVVALISIHASATNPSTCAHKSAGGMHNAIRKHSGLLPAAKSIVPKTATPVRARGTK